MKKFIMAILAIGVCSSAALANVPSPANCSVDPADNLNGLVVAPLDPTPIPASVNVVRVANASNVAIENASVVVTLTAANIVCGSTVLTGTTDASGEVTLTLGGGGCVDEVPLSGVIKANGVTIRSYENVKSPDYDGAGGDLLINLPDLLAFSSEFLGPPGTAVCGDYNDDDNCDLVELIPFSIAFTTPNSCSP